MTVEIRSLRAEDRADWFPLWRAYQVFYETDIPEEASRTTWARFLDPAEAMGGALAWEGGEPVGLVHWIRHRSTWTSKDYCYLQDLYVREAVRARGVGRLLIQHVDGVAREAGCSQVYWLTHETNARAMRLYDAVADRSGFVHYRKTLRGDLPPGSA